MIQKKAPPTHLFILIFLVCGLQLGCGWQLRGVESGLTDASAAEATYTSIVSAVNIINSTKLTQLSQQLKKKLTIRGILVNSDAQIQIHLLSERVEKRPMAYGSTGIAIQYQMTLRVSYAIRELLKESIEKQLISRRNFDFDPELVSAKDNEANDLRAEMRKEIVNKIITDLRKRS